MTGITIDVAEYTDLLLDLNDFDWEDVQQVIFTIKNSTDYLQPAVIERIYYEPGTYTVTITPEESILLTESAVYDFDRVMISTGNRYKASRLGKITLRRGAGDAIDETTS